MITVAILKRTDELVGTLINKVDEVQISKPRHLI
jgi:hypothetical protein